jgi:hypothetical protein
MNCAEVTERLPWWLNRTLAEAERAAVARHLEQCEACRRELDDTAAFLEQVEAHPAPQVLTDYVFGGENTEREHKGIRSHLEQCARCREEVELARRSRESMPVRPAWRRHFAGIAAGLLMSVSAGAVFSVWKNGRGRIESLEAANRGLLERLRLLEEPTAAARVIDLLPDSLRQRSTNSAAAAPLLASGGRETLLVLNSQLAGSGEACAVTLQRAGSAIWRAEKAERGANGEFLVKFPAGYLRKGAYSILLDCGGSAESYRFLVD